MGKILYSNRKGHAFGSKKYRMFAQLDLISTSHCFSPIEAEPLITSRVASPQLRLTPWPFGITLVFTSAFSAIS